MQDDITIAAARPSTKGDTRPVSTIKTILLHVQNDVTLNERIESALAIARATGAHISCVHITPFLAWGGDFGGVFTMTESMRALDEEEARLRNSVETKFRGEDVGWDYEQVTGDVAMEIARRSTLSDLIVMGREPFTGNYGPGQIAILGDVLHWSRTPLFIPVQDAPACDICGPAIIAWDGSGEAANAVRSSLGLLKMSSDVHLLQVCEKKPKEQQLPGTKLLEFLSRQGIKAELVVEECGKSSDDEDFVAATLMARARSLGGAYVVMGGYSHSRIGEYLFGGVTRIMLRRSSVPLVIAH